MLRYVKSHKYDDESTDAVQCAMYHASYMYLHEYDDESNDTLGIISGVPLLRGPLRVDPNDIIMAS